MLAVVEQSPSLIWGQLWYHHRTLYRAMSVFMLLEARDDSRVQFQVLTFTVVIGINEEVKVRAIAQTTLVDDFTLQFKD